MQAKFKRAMFSMEYSVSAVIDATPEKVWGILTEAKNYTMWNTTLIKLEGSIETGKKIKLISKLNPKKVFTLKVTLMLPPRLMTWEDGMAPLFKGKRTYGLEAVGDKQTKFTMSEIFAGVILPLIAGSLPDFGPSFEQFAKDLKNISEKL